MRSTWCSTSATRARRPWARAGGRLDHVWLPGGRSIYDALGADLTLLAFDEPGGRDDAERDDGAAVEKIRWAAAARGVPLEVVRLLRGLRERYGARLVIVRPDQHVAWRGEAPAGDAGALIDRIRGAGGNPRGS